MGWDGDGGNTYGGNTRTNNRDGEGLFGEPEERPPDLRHRPLPHSCSCGQTGATKEMMQPDLINLHVISLLAYSCSRGSESGLQL